MLAAIGIIGATAGAGKDGRTCVVLGVAVIITGAVIIGIDEFLSCKAHKEFVQAEKRRKQWEFKHDRAGRLQEMVKLFELKGMSSGDAELVVKKMANFENFFVSLMVTEGLGLQPPDDDDLSLFSDSFVMLLSYGGFGLLPMVIVYLMEKSDMSSRNLFETVGMSVAILLFILGSSKSSFSTSHWLHLGMETLAVGICCGIISFTVGATASSMI